MIIWAHNEIEFRFESDTTLDEPVIDKLVRQSTYLEYLYLIFEKADALKLKTKFRILPVIIALPVLIAENLTVFAESLKISNFVLLCTVSYLLSEIIECLLELYIWYKTK